MFGGLQPIHSHFFRQEAQWKMALLLSSIIHRCVLIISELKNLTYVLSGVPTL